MIFGGQPFRGTVFNPDPAQMPPDMGEPANSPTPGAMFGGGKKRSFGGKLADFLLYYAAARGSPVGQFALQSRLEDQRTARDQERRAAERQQALDDQWQMYVRKQGYEAANPQPTELERVMRSAGIDPASPEGLALLKQYATNRANPMQAINVQNPDGSSTMQFYRPPIGGAPSGVVDTEGWDDIGGAPAAPARPFR